MLRPSVRPCISSALGFSGSMAPIVNSSHADFSPTLHDQHGRWPQAESVEDFHRNLAAVHARIAAACQRAGRDPAGVCLLPVSKTVDEKRIRMSYAAGCRQLGENKVQEAYRK